MTTKNIQKYHFVCYSFEAIKTNQYITLTTGLVSIVGRYSVSLSILHSTLSASYSVPLLLLQLFMFCSFAKKNIVPNIKNAIFIMLQGKNCDYILMKQIFAKFIQNISKMVPTSIPWWRFTPKLRLLIWSICKGIHGRGQLSKLGCCSEFYS